MVDKLGAMRMFARIVESGSFSQAARDLNVSQPTASKQLAVLEARLGTQLLARNSRSLAVTPTGQDYYEATVRILQDLDSAEEKILEGQSTPSGLVRVTLPPAFGRMFVIPRLSDFRDSFPDVAIEMEVSGRHVDLIGEGIDVAVRIGRLSDSALFARRIGDMQMITMASASYLAQHGTPQTLDELRNHQRISYIYQGDVTGWDFHLDGRQVTIDGAGAFRTNDAEHVRGAVLAGLGIAHHASWLFTDVLASGEVKRILNQHAPPSFPINAVTAAGRRIPSRVRHFIHFLAAICAEVPELRTGVS
ncbi:LysR family transcriptional regulator [Erwiniaceae bacterium BAC15a-03b]|uniref:LysR family transcriptional regulator n=1 Tax=Winslowiella arboricola TaxID=2978220 RepID=A0A9J6PUL0_9GAMM|nr:LysR family transcriptional regulator [Winslowiella arboricola]MCU5775253.1 LysR family transcriptional regulator [Winslowiella arboricola]MCU5780350.1 LysR family transcriptional regulator [Winslowiella arboricola]